MRCRNDSYKFSNLGIIPDPAMLVSVVEKSDVYEHARTNFYIF